MRSNNEMNDMDPPKVAIGMFRTSLLWVAAKISLTWNISSLHRVG
jgi:hypothetical protein